MSFALTLCLTVNAAVWSLYVLVQVVRTKSVEYMPFALTLCLTVNATLWSLYGLFKDTYQDVNILFPDIIGFILGIFQMCLYRFYSRVGSQAADVETGRGQLEDEAALGGAGPVLEAVGDAVTELVEDGGRLIELPVGGGVGRAEEGSGSEEKADGNVPEDSGKMEVPTSGDREDGGGGDGKEGGEVAKGGGCGEGEESDTSDIFF
ncbi:hypothetical protein TSUD_390060 [Trifolium subterraneum]|uniref:Bidirectional sugar transporter SWEET n=1 Tax=Trifolium subterraneum TaxID=3900 RepID=A0A2Z6PGD5_TRISU|nr:hypothetical protein TSUD_390060 [Trifolium subterraneum]